MLSQQARPRPHLGDAPRGEETSGGRTSGSSRGSRWPLVCVFITAGPLADDLSNQGEFEDPDKGPGTALVLSQEALELFTEVRFQYAMSMCACICTAAQV